MDVYIDLLKESIPLLMEGLGLTMELSVISLVLALLLKETHGRFTKVS